MKKIFVFSAIIGLALLSAKLYAQGEFTEEPVAVSEAENSAPGFYLPDALLRIDRPQMVDTLLYNRMLARSLNSDMGFRVLIFSQSGNNSKDAAIQAKTDFEYFYPEYKAYLSFEEPYFKVKAGNFASRIDAEFFIREIKNLYPYAFIVKDRLNVMDYLGLEN